MNWIVETTQFKTHQLGYLNILINLLNKILIVGILVILYLCAII